MTGRACWTCGFQKIGGHLTFLGICGWFVTKGKPEKPIPADVVDVGCKFWLQGNRRVDQGNADEADTERPT